MVFSSLSFILVFLPVATLGYYAILRFGNKEHAFLFVLLCSLFYYAWWDVSNLGVILLSLLGNYTLGRMLDAAREHRKALFAAGVTLNLLALLYFKYTLFGMQIYTAVTGTQISAPDIVLPIGISFFTFQQIAYLSDIYTRKNSPVGEGLVSYGLFVCFFPQLVAGPIVHHREMMPQFDNAQAHVARWENIYSGLVLFSIGLAKKTLAADTLSPLVGRAFAPDAALSFADAWCGMLLYTFQLYFDFSGYSDMAVACALFFNIRLPWNFNSPYKACDIQDFWRRWHMTLGRWLRDYLYIPLGGNRRGAARTLLNLFLTFLLAGLWHGAAWTFVLWGAMHGAALVVHRVWKARGGALPRPLGWLLTFLFVNLAWVVFRAPDGDCLRRFFDGFRGAGGWALSEDFAVMLRQTLLMPDNAAVGFLLAGVLLTLLLARNSRELLEQPASLSLFFRAVVCLALSLLLLCIPDKQQEFIYFQF